MDIIPKVNMVWDSIPAQLAKENKPINILIKFFTYAYLNAKIKPVGISDYISFEMVATIQLHSTFPNFIIIGDTNERV